MGDKNIENLKFRNNEYQRSINAHSSIRVYKLGTLLFYQNPNRLFFKKENDRQRFCERRKSDTI